jgi:hypothetical protein
MFYEAPTVVTDSLEAYRSFGIHGRSRIECSAWGWPNSTHGGSLTLHLNSTSFEQLRGSVLSFLLLLVEPTEQNLREPHAFVRHLANPCNNLPPTLEVPRLEICNPKQQRYHGWRHG